MPLPRTLLLPWPSLYFVKLHSFIFFDIHPISLLLLMESGLLAIRSITVVSVPVKNLLKEL
jgi:hypothetical protein